MNAVASMRRVPLLSAAVCLAIATVASAQNADEAFRRGYDALEDKQWQDAAAALREAIKLRPQESSTRVRSGIGSVFNAGGTEYLPHFFLGRALYGSGDCVGATSEWAISEQQGAIQKSRPEFLRELQAGNADCEKRGVMLPARFGPAMERLFAALESATRQQTNLANLAEANVDVWRAEAAIRDQYERGKGDIETARARYDEARKSRLQRDVDAATQALERGRPVLDKVEAALRGAIDSRSSAQAAARSVRDAIRDADTLLKQIEGQKVTFTPEMTTAHQEGRAALGRANERLAEGERTLSPQTLGVARTAAVEAQTRFRDVLGAIERAVRDNLQRQISEALTRTLDAFSLLDSAVEVLDRFTSQRPGVLDAAKDAERKAALEAVERARRRLGQARKSDNLALINDAGRLADEARERLNAVIGAFGPLTLRDRGVHAMLEQGARQYLAGDYHAAAASLAAGESEGEGVALRLHFHLLRAAALYELFLRSHGKDQALEAGAREEVLHSKAIDSAFQPDARAFSPRFISFYANVAPPAAPPSAADPAPAPQP